MAWIEFHVKASGDPILVSVDQIVRIGVAVGDGKAPGTFIKQVDGSTVEVIEEYGDVVRKITGA